MLLSEAFLKRTLKVIKNVEKLLEDPTEDNLHNLRVESRKLESLLMNLGVLSGNNDYLHHLKSIRRFIKLFGPSRETDVCLLILKEYTENNKQDDALKIFAELLGNDSIRLRRKIFTSKRLVDFLLSKTALEDYVRNKMFSETEEISIESFCGYLAKSLSALYEKMFVLKLPVVSSEENKKELHKLRLRAKPLRYTLDLINEVIGLTLTVSGQGIKNIVNLAGSIHDLDVLIKKALEARSSIAVSSDPEEQNKYFEKFDIFLETVQAKRKEEYSELKKTLKMYDEETGRKLVLL